MCLEGDRRCTPVPALDQSYFPLCFFNHSASETNPRTWGEAPPSELSKSFQVNCPLFYRSFLLFPLFSFSFSYSNTKLYLCLVNSSPLPDLPSLITKFFLFTYFYVSPWRLYFFLFPAFLNCFFLHSRSLCFIHYAGKQLQLSLCLSSLPPPRHTNEPAEEAAGIPGGRSLDIFCLEFHECCSKKSCRSENDGKKIPLLWGKRAGWL